MSEGRRRWAGKQLAVGILGRHRPCLIELTSSGILRILAINSMGTQSPKEKFAVEGEGYRTTTEAECWVEDLAGEVELKARGSRPDLNALHFLFPGRERRIDQHK
eukprot:530919-Hanusia_phi.AAC.1